MPRIELPFKQPPLLERKQIDCVEIYVPKSIEFLSELYQMLRNKTKNRLGNLVLDGFSICEVDGVFHGENLWEQRTLVIRILLARKESAPAEMLEETIFALGHEIERPGWPFGKSKSGYAITRRTCTSSPASNGSSTERIDACGS